MNTPIAPGFELQNKVAELANAILARHPTMPTLLREIHTTLRKYPENVTLLTDEEIATIVRGLENQTNTYLASTVTGAKKSTVKSLTAKLNALGDDAF
jgi:hypothetical protein